MRHTLPLALFVLAACGGGTPPPTTASSVSLPRPAESFTPPTESPPPLLAGSTRLAALPRDFTFAECPHPRPGNFCFTEAPGFQKDAEQILAYYRAKMPLLGWRLRAEEPAQGFNIGTQTWSRESPQTAYANVNVSVLPGNNLNLLMAECPPGELGVDC
jgi:hypothetical protein